MSDDADDELSERRNAELEFVSAAYDPQEAWSSIGNDGFPSIHRRLTLPLNDKDMATVMLELTMPAGYPLHSPLKITAKVEDSSCSSNMKPVWDVLPLLLETCREEADNAVGMEAVFAVLSRADDWISEDWPKYCIAQEESSNNKQCTSTLPPNPASSTILGRRLIYSHHLISKVKRADIRALASHYDLTGYVKIGWPGIILIEGSEESCIAFYDDIRGWAWKYLVVRGEQQEENGTRKFASLVETEDMSVVAEHCREAGLEALFKTSMKVYENHEDNCEEEEAPLWGTLVLVDHMNDAKMYRKWLRKTSRQLDCLLFIQQCYLDYTKRPLIVVGVVGTSVPEFMKRWRTSRTDVDSKGRPCLERQMTVIIDGPVDCSRVESLEWDKLQSDEHVNVNLEKLRELVDNVGGPRWSSAFDGHIKF